MSIVINKSFSVLNGEGANFFFSTGANIKFSPQQGVIPSDGIINVQLEYSSIDDFAQPIELKVVKDLVCVKTYTFAVSSPCNSLTAVVKETDPLNFTVDVSGGEIGYTYKWSYDTTVFKPTADTTSNLVLTPKPEINIPPESSLTLTVTDRNGCSVQDNYAFSITGPNIQNQSKTAICISPRESSCGFEITQYAAFVFSDYADLDFDNADLTYDVGKVCIARTQNGYSVLIAKTNDVVTVTGKIPNKLGIYSNVFKLTIFPKDCVNVTEDTPVDTGVTSVPSTDFVKGVLITDLVQNVDLDCFEFLNIDNVTVISATEIQTNSGTYTYKNGYITYTYGGVNPADLEKIVFKVCKGDNDIIIDLINDFTSLPAPVIENGTVWTSCDAPLNVDIRFLISGQYNIETLEIEVPATNTTVTVNSDYTLNFVQNTVNDFLDQVQISVKNRDGVKSENGIIYIQRVCAGRVQNPVKDITCETKTFNLIDVLLSFANYYVAGYEWEEVTLGANTYTDQGGVILNNTNGAVDFTNIVAGDYTFKTGDTINAIPYQGSILLTPQVTTQSFITIRTALAETLTIDDVTIDVNGVEVYYTIENYTSLRSFDFLVDGVSYESSNSVRTDGKGFLTFVVDGPGTYSIKLRAVDICGNIISDSETIIIS